jgi:transposase
MVEELPLISPYDRVTKRLAFYIIDLCQSMTIKEVAEHFGLNWKTVKEIHKQYLQERFSQEEIGDPGIIVVDEISIRKGHSYLTAIVDWESGRVLWIGEGRRYETLKEFFDSLSEEQRASIEAVAIDMWDPYIKAIEEHCPQAMIVFDLFHVVAAFGRAIDKIRNQEYKKANQSGKEVIKGSKYLLLKNKENITKEERPRLKALLKLNEPLTIAYILKDDLKNLWRYRYSKWAEKAIDNWCHLAYESKIKPLLKFAKTLKRYAHGIINHCRYPIHTSGMEGIINKIKVIKRKAYGYHDLEYFSLVIKSAFADIN